MPLFFQNDIDADTRLAVWKIEEEEPFFTEKVPLHRQITHPHKRLQHLAGRYLLQALFPDFPIGLIQVADTRKPFLEDEAYHFSISHCSDYAAVIVSKTKRVGIDIELVNDKIGRIEHKFVNDEEGQLLKENRTVIDKTKTLKIPLPNQQLIMLWSCKEAVFKWYGLGNVDFKKHMQVNSIANNIPDAYHLQMAFKKNEDQMLDLHSLFFDNVCLSYVVT